MEGGSGGKVDCSAVVRLSGDPAGLRGEVGEALAAEPRTVVFDLSELTSFSSEDLAALRETAQPSEAVFACREGGVARQVLEEEGVLFSDSAAEALAFEDEPPRPSGERFRSLTEMLLAARSVGDVLQLIVDATASLAPSADLVSITLRAPDGNFHTAAYTDPKAADLDLLQYKLGEGPCHDAAVPGRPEFLESADLDSDAQWPRWSPEAAGLGWRAVLATALVDDAVSRFSGALNLYSRTPGGLADVDRDVVLLLASHATLAVAETDAVTRNELNQAQLRRALDSRDVIGQAKGIIMARRGLDAQEAFDLLRRTSQQLNVKLVHLAGTLVARHEELDGPVAEMGEPDPV
ncbi:MULTISPECIES: GAF and ANTAR domain-containing protein [Amycolatopsis]|uniref:GAF domain-containing protein n=1 Tax=Amycolatopsis rubida TaxID=112413 RepID=A0A1I5RUU4_9PSEU|nr:MULTISPECIES: GAF and ANTAR domain-containing protein [Amycolatopsis]OAP21382.1 ANTAR domain protein [Amycolatopsis sp. M39]SFP62349.1 GAF domain-containing protein [Amycolatopsis rubida]